jgi:hypothetical protein
MSVHARLYQCYKKVAVCNLVKSRLASPENISEFQQLLNDSLPKDATESAMKDFTRGLYNSNQVGFLKYITNKDNRVSSLILWTESKRIVRYFRLTGLVFILWNDTDRQYRVTVAENKEKREETDTPNAASTNAESAPVERRNNKPRYILKRPNKKEHQ